MFNDFSLFRDFNNGNGFFYPVKWKLNFRIIGVGVKGSNRYGQIIDRLTFVLGVFAFKGKLKSRDIFKRFLSDFNGNQCV